MTTLNNENLQSQIMKLMNAGFRFVGMHNGKSRYMNVTNDHDVVIEFFGEYWAMRIRSGEDVAVCHSFSRVQDQHPPIGSTNRWEHVDGTATSFVEKGEYSEIESLIFVPRDAEDHEKCAQLFQVYELCMRHAPYTSKQKESGKKRPGKVNFKPAKVCVTVTSPATHAYAAAPAYAASSDFPSSFLSSPLGLHAHGEPCYITPPAWAPSSE
jgi:hypothetical protein